MRPCNSVAVRYLILRSGLGAGKGRMSYWAIDDDNEWEEGLFVLRVLKEPLEHATMQLMRFGFAASLEQEM